MQQTGHNLGHRKHRQAFGEGKRHKTARRLVYRANEDSNRESERRKEIRRRQRDKMFASIQELMHDGR